MPRYLLAFESTHAAMAANKALVSAGPAVIPTPRAISASCGMSLRFDAADRVGAEELAAGVEEARGLASLYADEAGGYRLLRKL